MTDVAERLVSFVEALRLKGINAGPSETIDAAQVATVLGFDDREILREGLAAALVRRDGQRDVFDMTFDLFFPAGIGAPEAARDELAADTVEQLRDLLAMALADDDPRALDQLAEVAVHLLGEVGRPDTSTAACARVSSIGACASP